MGDLDFEAILSIQLTVGVLLHSVPRGACFTPGALDMATPIANTSAANSRSEFVRRPDGLSSEITSDEMSGGKALRQREPDFACTLRGCIVIPDIMRHVRDKLPHMSWA